ncbi:MAG TPA: hypothetical protein VF752_01310, partial [Thermoleophilaceae bacterium]
AVLAAVSYVVWWGLDKALGRALWAQVVSVGGGISAGFVAYAAVVWALGIDEARQIWNLFAGRFKRRQNT